MGCVGHIVFYAKDGLIAGNNPIWVQMKLTAVVSIFDRVGLLTNIGKTKAMVCTPGFIKGQQGTATYKSIAKGEGGTFQERIKTRVSYEEKRGRMVASSLSHHTNSTHGIGLIQNQG